MSLQVFVVFLLIIHIICGFSSLFLALGAMLSPKGQAKHRKLGRLFFYGMTGIFITAIPLSLIKNNLFLFLIAFFSYYLAFSGWRYAKNKEGNATKLDFLIGSVMLTISLIMVGIGVYRFHIDNFRTISLLVFGVIGFILSWSDLKAYRNHSATGKQRIANHLGAMLGATIATLTAFSVTNLHVEPQIILWLGPTLLLTPVIIYWKHTVMKNKNSYSIG